MTTKTAKIVIEAEPDLVEAIIAAVEPILTITDRGRNARLKLSPDKVRRTLRAGLVTHPHPEPVEGQPPTLDHLTDLATAAGAEGIWFIRGAEDPYLIYTPAEGWAADDDKFIHLSLRFDIATAGILAIIRFPRGDGGEPGIESR